MHTVRTPRRMSLVRGAAAAAMIAAALQPHGALAASNDVVATVNGVALHRAELDTAMVGRQESARGEVLQGLVARELLRQAAERDGLGTSQPVRAAMEKAKVDTENRLYVAKHLPPQAVTDAEIRQRYDATVARLGPYEYRVSHMSFADEPSARFAITMLENGTAFANVATRAQATDVQTEWISFKTPVVEGQTQGLPVELAQALATMKPTQFTGVPLHVGDRFVVARIDDRRDTVIPSFADAQGELRKSMEGRRNDDAFAAFVGQLAQKAVIRPAQILQGVSK
ncbi:TPA: peptidyl-prolyl cis-trans isomerase [Burkholderia vietnamiensis]|nr:PpiC-type peptidyl-prolyl cis-trans isomerase [Burkholderia vietnamiensis]HDR9055961.1 peptidyl-prolyl cis-trans isomerase [Burkholderia vietnamiensis]HDR9157057.1 peptidyl-prolyl cis-trans isomerase [Burkholderia vietnamiensis]